MAHIPIIKLLWACGSPTPTLTHWSLWVTHVPQIVINIQSSSILPYIDLLVTLPLNLVMVTRNRAGSMWVRRWDVVWTGGAPKVSPTHAYYGPSSSHTQRRVAECSAITSTTLSEYSLRPVIFLFAGTVWQHKYHAIFHLIFILSYYKFVILLYLLKTNNSLNSSG